MDCWSWLVFYNEASLTHSSMWTARDLFSGLCHFIIFKSCRNIIFDIIMNVSNIFMQFHNGTVTLLYLLYIRRTEVAFKHFCLFLYWLSRCERFVHVQICHKHPTNTKIYHMSWCLPSILKYCPVNVVVNDNTECLLEAQIEKASFAV